MTEFSIEQYDQKIMNPGIQLLYEHSGFYNVGDWSKKPKGVSSACHDMVQRHLTPFSENSVPLKILDMGCGLGAATKLIGQFYQGKGDVVGINISEKQIDFASRNHGLENVTFKVMDAANPDFESNFFDQIISIEAAFHFNTRAQFIQNAYRILKPGGSLTFTDILFNDTDAVGSWSVPEANRITDLAAYNQICTDPGFRVIRQYDITDISWKGFCNHISKFPGMQKMAEKLLPSVAVYVFSQLEKPTH